MRKMSFLLVLFGLLCGCNEEMSNRVPQRSVPQSLLKEPLAQQQGAALFARHCRECHGSRTEGRTLRLAAFNPPAPDFIDPGYADLDPAYLFWRISKGKMVEPFFTRGSVMPAFEGYFSEQQIWQLVAYLRERSAGKVGILR